MQMRFPERRDLAFAYLVRAAAGEMHLVGDNDLAGVAGIAAVVHLHSQAAAAIDHERTEVDILCLAECLVDPGCEQQGGAFITGEDLVPRLVGERLEVVGMIRDMYPDITPSVCTGVITPPRIVLSAWVGPVAVGIGKAEVVAVIADTRNLDPLEPVRARRPRSVVGAGSAGVGVALAAEEDAGIDVARSGAERTGTAGHGDRLTRAGVDERVADPPAVADLVPQGRRAERAGNGRAISDAVDADRRTVC